MKKCLLAICMLFCSLNSFAQNISVFDAVRFDFNSLLNQFIQMPTDPSRNEKIYNRLEELLDLVKTSDVPQEERYRVNNLLTYVKVFQKFIAPVAKKANFHLTEDDMFRLQRLFGQHFVTVKLNVRCPKDEMEFIEVRLGSLMINYFHCITKNDLGLVIKFYAESGNMKNIGEYGASKNEYTPLLHNAGNVYLRINSAVILNRIN